MSRFTLPALLEDLGRSIAPTPLSGQVRSALELAYLAHEGQFREQRNQAAPKIPYIAHPVGVAKIAAKCLPMANLPDSTDDVLCASLTHDVLEDTTITLGELERKTSARTARIVLALTKPPLNQTMSRGDRNKAFIEQIVQAGPTAQFIKICDAMHNLSRPKNMPASLLDKTIKKALQDYLPLAIHPRFSAGLQDAFEGAIWEASKQLESLGRGEPTAFQASLEAAIGFTIAKARGKVLEEHDIVELLETVANVRLSFIGSIERYVDLKLAPFLENTDPATRKSITSELERGKLDFKHPLFSQSRVKERSVTRILACPLAGTSTGRPERQFFTIATEATPAWLDANALCALVAIASQRMQERDSRQVGTIAEALSRLELPLDPQDALRAGLTHGRLLSLKAQLDAANFVHGVLTASLQQRLLQNGTMREVDRVESRVKNATSIVRKMIQRNMSDLNELDDLVGLRIVVLSTKTQKIISEFLMDELSTETSDLSRLLPIEQGSVTSTLVRSDEGYKSVHVRFRADAPSRQLAAISCEVQVRTLLEDAWARVSQLVRYKQSRNDRRTVAVLGQLARARDELDEKLGSLK